MPTKPGARRPSSGLRGEGMTFEDERLEQRLVRRSWWECLAGMSLLGAVAPVGRNRSLRSPFTCRMASDASRRRDPDAAATTGAGGSRVTVWLLGGILALASLWALRALASVTLPLACALFIGLAVLPIHEAVARRVPPRLRWLGYAAAMSVVVGFLLVFAAGITLAAQQVAGSADQILPRIQQQIARLSIPMVGDGEQILPRLVEGLRSYAQSLASGAGKTLAGLVLILFLVLLMLTEARAWRAKLAVASPEGKDRGWAEVASAVGQRFRRYFLARLFLGAVTALLYAGWLALFGVPLILVWAMLALLLNFIPTIGSLIAGALPVLFALALKDPGSALAVAGGLLVIEQVMGNFVDPKVMGRQLSISPLVVLTSLLLWSWVWGIGGALIAVPMTVLVTIAFAHVPALKPIALFLSNESDMRSLERRTAPN